MSYWKNYLTPTSPSEALAAYHAASGSAKFIAGGTDLLLDLQQGRHSPVDTLIDVTRITDAICLELRPQGLYIGAGVPLNHVVASPLVKQHTPALEEAAGLIGGPQVRNTATLGGNVSHALPAADGAISLLALDAQAHVFGANGLETRPLISLYLGPGRSALDEAHELLIGFTLPLRGAGEGSAFRRVMRPQGVAIAIMNMAAWLRREGDHIAAARISVGPAGPKPLRAVAAEAALIGRPLDEAALTDASTALLGETRFRTSPHRATAEYRRQIAPVLLAQVLKAAWERTAG